MISLLRTESKSITGGAIVIALATLMSRLVGIIRDRIFAHYFGAGAIMDAYYAAFKIPDLIYNLLVVGALTAGFIPVFTKLYHQEKPAAWKLANNVLTIIGLLIGTLALIGIYITPTLAHIIAPTFSGEGRALVITFTRIMFLSPVFLGISMVFGGILQSLKQFTLYSLAPVAYNVGIIIGAVGIVPLIGISGLAWGVVLGAALHAGLQIWGASLHGFTWRWHLDFKDTATRLIGKLMIPRTIGLAITHLNTIIVTILATYLTTGSVAIYNFANNLQAVPTGLIGIPFALAVFPTLSALIVAKEKTAFAEEVFKTIRKIIFLIIPATALVMLLRAQIVRVVLGSGAFNWTATIATADALAFFALGLWAQSLIPLLARAFFADSNTKTPFVIGVIAELISITTALLLMRPFGVAGLALAASIGAICNCLLLLIVFYKTYAPKTTPYAALYALEKIIIAALGMTITLQALKYPLAQILNLDTFVGILLQGLISGIVGLLVYGCICYLLKLEEFAEVRQILRRKWLSWRHIAVPLDETERL